MHSTRCPEAQYWSKWELLRLLVQSLCRLHAFPQSSLWRNRSAATASRGHTPKLSLPHPTPWPPSGHSPLNPPSSSPWLKYHSFGHGQCKSRCETLTARLASWAKLQGHTETEAAYHGDTLHLRSPITCSVRRAHESFLSLRLLPVSPLQIAVRTLSFDLHQNHVPKDVGLMSSDIGLTY